MSPPKENRRQQNIRYKLHECQESLDDLGEGRELKSGENMEDNRPKDTKGDTNGIVHRGHAAKIETDHGSPVDHTRDGETKEHEGEASTLSYRVRDNPPWAVTVMAAFQHILLSVSSCLTTSSVVADVACVPFDHPVRSKLFSTTVFMVGICTIIQTALGVRLPIFQGPSSSFLVPLLALQTDPSWKCKVPPGSDGVATNTSTGNNGTNTSVPQASESDVLPDIEWRLQEMSGALMIASLIEVVVGVSGLLNVLLHHIGPIPVACTISLIGVSLYKIPITYGRPNFPVAISVIVLIMVFVLYLQNIGIPLPKFGKKSKKEPRRYFHIFLLIPIILAVVIIWVVTWILTVCNVFTSDRDDITFLARADAKNNIIRTSDWFQLTYPGQFGAPRINVALMLGFSVAIISSVVESVGDYYAAKRACEVPTLPDHAISRGILLEGLGSVLSGSVGAGHATTSYSTNIAVLTLTKTASRIIMYVAGGILLAFSLLGKAAAAICTIPNPILGGVMMVVIGTLLSIGLSNLRQVDMTSSRNMLVVGVPFMAGLVVPESLEAYPELINTGSPDADRVIRVVLGTPMFLGGVLALILDATAPGTRESRGMDSWFRDGSESQATNTVDAVYSWSIYPRLVKICHWIVYLPFMPKMTEDMTLSMNSATEDTIL